MLLDISFEEVMLNSPHYVFWKDKNSVYLGCNQNLAKLFNFGSPDEIVGKSDFDLNLQDDGDSAETFRLGDINTINGNFLVNAKEMLSLASGKIIISTNKRTLINKKHNVVGVFGVLIDITPNAQPINNMVLTKRQTECLYYLVRGMTAKQIGRKLDLSYRTIEFYLENIKNKFKCNSKSDLIAKAIELEFGNIR